MRARQSSATEPGERFVAALSERDFEKLSETLAPDARMRALLPSGLTELSGAEDVGARFASWFGNAVEFELTRSGTEQFADRLHVFYRLRMRRHGEFPKLVEQHLLCTSDGVHITSFDLVCTGFRPETGWMMPRPRSS